LTIVSSGYIENSKKLVPKIDRSLTFFIEPKYISDKDYIKLKKNNKIVFVKDGDKKIKMDPNFENYIFNFDNKKKRFSLNWTWSGTCQNCIENPSKEFKQSFNGGILKISGKSSGKSEFDKMKTSLLINKSKFIKLPNQKDFLITINNIRYSISKLFNLNTNEIDLILAWKKPQLEKKKIYVGKGDELINLLINNKKICKELDNIQPKLNNKKIIVNVTLGTRSKENDIISQKTKQIAINNKEKYALYVKDSTRKLAMFTPFKEFIMDKKLI